LGSSWLGSLPFVAIAIALLLELAPKWARLASAACLVAAFVLAFPFRL
jgi:hypothetical protein